MGKDNIIQQKDHIILPKATLMRFIDGKQRIYYLDLNDLDDISVKHIYPKSYHVIPNYYNPEYDDKVKKHETAIGKLYKEISKAIENNTSINIDADTLRKQIIGFLTIEFHRSVIADDAMLEKYKNQQQKENDKIDSIMFQTGTMTASRIEYSINFREQAKSLETFRNYAQNILGTDNSAISATYCNFIPKILYIPKNRDCQFLLPPLHFVGNENFACFTLAPNVALALYPTPIGNSLMLAVDKKRVAAINLRILECVSVFDSDYKEIVGGEDQLCKLKERIVEIKSICKISESGIVINNDESFCVHGMDEVMAFVIILHLLSKAPKDTLKVRMKIQNFDKEFLEKSKNEIEKLFKKYSFELTM